MKLSQILAQSSIGPYEIINEHNFSTLGLTESVTEISMCTFLDNEKYIDTIPGNVTMVITNKIISEKLTGELFGICIVENPRIFFFQLHNYLQNHSEYKQKQYQTIIGEDCNISPLAHIATKNVTIGNNVIIEEFVSIKENTTIGEYSIIRAGSVIGGEGFEFKRVDDKVMGVKHLGSVIIGSNVEIQQNVAVEKAVYPWDKTEIKEYTKIDDLVHIGHAAKIKKGAMIVAQSGIGGRTIIGENTWIGFGATVTNGITVGDNARVQIGAVVTKAVNDNESVSGNFAIDHKKFIEHIKNIR